MKIKRSIIVTLLAIGIGLGWLSLSGARAVLEQSSSTEFCLSCHSMETAYKEYQGSVHFSNAKGIRAECADCHIPNDTLGYAIAKLKFSADIYHEFASGRIDSDEKYETHRADMASTVWSQLKANDSATCRNCHNETAMELYNQDREARNMHQYAVDNNQTCIDCHKGVAHLLPKAKMDNQAQQQLIELAKQTPADARLVYPLQTIAMGELGTINPATELTVLDTQAGKRRVEMRGAQMYGAEQVIYVAQGQRAIIALLTEQGQRAIKVGQYQSDAYGNNWRDVTLTAEIDDTPVLTERAPLWAYAEQLDNAYCSSCHAKIPSTHFTLNAWPSVAKTMGDRTSIGGDDLEILTKFFQYNAKDAKDVVAH